MASINTNNADNETDLKVTDEESNNNSNNNNNESSREESCSLRYLLGDFCTIEEFFEKIWQNSCVVFSHPKKNHISARQDEPWNNNDNQIPICKLLNSGWTVLLDLMDQNQRRRRQRQQQQQQRGMMMMMKNDNDDDDSFSTPLLFRNCLPIDIEERTIKYYDYKTHTENLYAAFLDGCSIVINHADCISPWIAELCNDLQHTFPHVYANVYITPSQSQAVPAHSDDRDVFVIQVYGKKHWKVYQRIPILYPYTHEQVGKNEHMPVPDEIMNGPILIDKVLEAGEVLYMPRGYVHEAMSCNDDCSFHVTIALATHDWTLAGLMNSASQHVFFQQQQHLLRKAIHRDIGCNNKRIVDASIIQNIQEQINDTIEKLKNELTITNIEIALHNKYKRHNQRADIIRIPLIQNYYNNSIQQYNNSNNNNNTLSCTTGPDVVQYVNLTTWLRASTDEEKNNTIILHNNNKKGLHVREEIYDNVLNIIDYIKKEPSCQLITLSKQKYPLICHLTLICIAKRCVELGALSIVHNT